MKLTSGSCWKITTRPPLSPVASSSPEWLNSTVDMMSAVNKEVQLGYHQTLCRFSQFATGAWSLLCKSNVCQMWQYFCTGLQSLQKMHKILSTALKILYICSCFLHLQYGGWKHRAVTYMYSIYTQCASAMDLKSTKHSWEGGKKTCPVQLFSTYQRKAFSSNPTTQQSIPVHYSESAILNIDYGVVPLLPKHTKCLIRPDSIQTLIQSKRGQSEGEYKDWLTFILDFRQSLL